MDWIAAHPLNILLLGAVSLFGLIISLSLFVYEKRVGKVLRKQFEQSRTEYDERTKQKNEFMSFATHQLRSPLTALSWGLDSLLGDKERFSPEHLLILEKLRVTTKDLTETVNDLLDMSLIEQKGMVLNKTSFDVGVLVSLVSKMLEPIAQKKNLQLSCLVNSPGIMISGDQVKLRQVFMNLIENSIKYTDTGSVAVVVSAGNNGASVSIRDTGRGISSEDMKKLFQKFERGSMRSADHPGSGLGLYLSKQIIELHGGVITLSSPGVSLGTTATITLPIQK